ncbi:MAG: N-acetylmuramoyl-L-alanine amidase family protein [Oscillospiraceae bacterium]|nr:N-acetylmuramoyl-L-alanine amidase family protein [Oscillospiraceae bacterium]
MKKLTKTLTCAAMAAIMTVSSGMCAVTASADWHKTSSGYYYTDSDGDRLTGWQTIGSGKYYFNSKGYATTGFKTISGKKYYFSSAKKGKMATGWLKISGEKYYFGSDGVMRTGWKKIGGKTYYFSKNGKMTTGTVKIDGEVCKFDENGVLKSRSDSASSSSSSGSFTSKPMGKSKWGVSSKNFLKSNGITDYSVKDGEETTMYMFEVDNYLGEKVGVAAIFLDDKLVCIGALAIDGTFSNAALKKIEKVYGEPFYSDSDGTGWLTEREIIVVMEVEEGNEMLMIMDTQSGISEDDLTDMY